MAQSEALSTAASVSLAWRACSVLISSRDDDSIAEVRRRALERALTMLLEFLQGLEEGELPGGPVARH